MGVTEEVSSQRFDKAAWAIALAAALALNVSGWFLPIAGNVSGLEGARWVPETRPGARWRRLARGLLTFVRYGDSPCIDSSDL